MLFHESDNGASTRLLRHAFSMNSLCRIFHMSNNSNRISKWALKAFAYFFSGNFVPIQIRKSPCKSLVDRKIPVQGADYNNYFGDSFPVCGLCVWFLVFCFLYLSMWFWWDGRNLNKIRHTLFTFLGAFHLANHQDLKEIETIHLFFFRIKMALFTNLILQKQLQSYRQLSSSLSQKYFFYEEEW